MTDLPWATEWLPNVPDFAEWCARVLAPDGIMVTWYGQHHLDRCMEALGLHLKYQWLFIGPFCGGAQQKAPFLCSCYRPALVYTAGEPLRLHRAVDDWTPSVLHREKDLHPHQQSIAPTQYLVEAFSQEGDLVCDPCSGSFTTAEACWHTNRRFVGRTSTPSASDWHAKGLHAYFNQPTRQNK